MIRKKRFEVNGRFIGDTYPTFIIAEIGINHNGSLKIAKNLIDKAKNFGVDSVKFQSFKTEKLISLPDIQMDVEEEKNKQDLFKFLISITSGFTIFDISKIFTFLPILLNSISIVIYCLNS